MKKVNELEIRIRSQYTDTHYKIAIIATRELLASAFRKYPKKSKLQIIAVLLGMVNSQLKKDLIVFVGLDMVTETHSEP